MRGAAAIACVQARTFLTAWKGELTIFAAYAARGVSRMVETATIGPYRILEPLGSGGMGVVYRARHVSSQHAVALKTVQIPAPKWLDSMRREIQALTRIRHPGVVRIVAHGVDHGRPWYAMDLIEGESLRRFGQRVWSPFQRRPTPMPPTAEVSSTESVTGQWTDWAEERSAPPPPERQPQAPELPPVAAGQLAAVLGIVRKVCATLAYLHGEGFVNGDLKPDNVLLVGDQPIVIDFGLTAHHPGGLGREELEAQRGMAGTLPYMSPEQFRGEFLDARSDLYSVGCMLYELLTGSPPFVGAPRRMMQQHLTASPAAPSGIVTGVSWELERLTLKLLEKDVNHRYGYADEVASELAAVSHDTRRLSGFPSARPYLYRPRFVGREAVLLDLTTLREAAAHGSGAFALVGGESGVGKTRLAMELTRFIPSTQMRVVTSETAALSAKGARPLTPAPLHALRSLLQTVADRCQEGGPDVTEHLLGHRRGVLAMYEPLLAEVPADGDLPSAVPLAPDAARLRLFLYLSETLSAFVEDQPLLWVLDDLGWADELSLAFLRSLSGDFLSAHPCLILGTYRSEEPSEAISALAELPHVRHFVLPRLGEDAVRSMVGDMLALPQSLDRFTDFVASQTEGNPFFVAEYLRTAVSERALFRNQRNAWQLLDHDGAPAEYESLGLPRSLLALIEQRLRNLSAAAREVSLAAAVLGRETRVDMLCEVASVSEDTSTAAIHELMRRQVLEQPEPETVRFAHDKLREVTYAQASADQLQSLHARAATALETRCQGRADANRHWATLGHHFASALDPERACKYLNAAADHARKTHANRAAIRLYQQAIEQVETVLARPEPAPVRWLDTRMELHEALGDVMMISAQRADARAAYEQALSQTGVERSSARARLHRKLGKTWEAEHRHDEALRCYDQAREALPTEAPRAPLAERDEWIQLRIDQLWVYYWLNRIDDMEAAGRTIETVIREQATASQRARFFHTQALQNLRRDRYVVSERTMACAQQAVEACDPRAAAPESPMIRFLYGFVLVFHDSLEAAQRELSSALAQAERAGDTAQQARCLTYLAVVARRRGLVEEAADLAARSVDASKQAAMRDYLAAAWANQAWVALARQDHETAATLATRAYDAWQNLKADFPFHWLALLPLLRLALRKDSIPPAVEYAQAMLASGQHELPSPGADWLRRGVEAWAAGDAATTQSCLSEAMQTLEAARYR